MGALLRAVAAVAATAAATVAAGSPPAVISVGSKTISTTNSRYASWTVDASWNRGFFNIDFDNKNLLAGAQSLAPSTLRFGGSGNDYLRYGPPGHLCDDLGEACASNDPPIPSAPQCCLNATHWDALYRLAESSKTDFLFGLSFDMPAACSQNASYVWDSAQAELLIKYMLAQNQTMWGFELGNEVDNRYLICELEPKQQADAFTKLQGLVAELYPDASTRPKLVGPDVGYQEPEAWLRGFLGNFTGAHAVSYHVYSNIERRNFNAEVLIDWALRDTVWYVPLVHELAPGAEVWAGEDGPIGGGDDGTCINGGPKNDSACGLYATTLWYANDLGIRAKAGFAQYQRQDLLGGRYGLLSIPGDDQRLGPTDPVGIQPDFWINFMWKRIMGNQVLNATATNTAAALRVYAHAGAPPSEFRAEPSIWAADASTGAGGGVGVVIINIGNVSVPVEMTGSHTRYELTPGTGGVFTKTTLLNGKRLPSTITTGKPINDIPVPGIKGAAGFDVAPYGIVFLVAQR